MAKLNIVVYCYKHQVLFFDIIFFPIFMRALDFHEINVQNGELTFGPSCIKYVKSFPLP